MQLALCTEQLPIGEHDYATGGLSGMHLDAYAAPAGKAAEWQPPTIIHPPGGRMAEDLAFLIYRTGLGDQRAFEKLYRDTSPRLFALALLVLRRRDQAEDALQDAFVSIWNSASSYNPDKGTAQTWLNVIVRHRCIDRLRREPKGSLQLADEDWAAFEANGPGPLQLLLSDADGKLLAGCLEQLDGKQRESVSLAFFHGLTHSELANHLRTPLGTVKAWVRRGLEKLRGCLHHEI